MTRFAIAAVVAALAAPAAFDPAAAQSPPPPLAFVQPLAPPALRAVQDRLHQMGAYQGAVDGNWGPDSEGALQQFQQTHNLQVTGQMNPGTAAVLGLNPVELLQLPGAPPADRPAPIRLGQDAIRNIQTQLQRLGFYTGALDGAWGPGTQSAISRLQQNHGIQPTGRLDPQTVSAMGLDPNNPGAPPP